MTHPAMSAVYSLLREIQDEFGLKQLFNLTIEKERYYGSGSDPLNFTIRISAGDSSVIGKDPHDVLTELIRRNGWQQRQDHIMIAPPVREAEEAEIVDGEDIREPLS